MNDMKNEVRARQLANMHKCLEISAKVWTHVEACEDTHADIHVDTVMKIVATEFPVPFVRPRQDACMEQLALIINSYGLTSCGLWSFAHALDHALLDEDLPAVH